MKNIFKTHYADLDLNNKINLLGDYLFLTNQTLLFITTEQVNMSFQDIIYNVHNQWQVGYSGTTSIDLNQYYSKRQNKQ